MMNRNWYKILRLQFFFFVLCCFDVFSLSKSGFGDDKVDEAMSVGADQFQEILSDEDLRTSIIETGSSLGYVISADAKELLQNMKKKTLIRMEQGAVDMSTLNVELGCQQEVIDGFFLETLKFDRAPSAELLALAEFMKNDQFNSPEAIAKRAEEYKSREEVLKNSKEILKKYSKSEN